MCGDPIRERCSCLDDALDDDDIGTYHGRIDLITLRSIVVCELGIFFNVDRLQLDCRGQYLYNVEGPFRSRAEE